MGQHHEKEYYEENIVACINGTRQIVFISDIFSYYTEISSSNFYKLELEKSEAIKEALNANRAIAKHVLRTKWIQSENPTLQICAYRILADEDERRAIDQRYSDVTVNGKLGMVSEDAYNNLVNTLDANGRLKEQVQ